MPTIRQAASWLLHALDAYFMREPDALTSTTVILSHNLAESVAHDDEPQLLQATAICIDFLSSEGVGLEDEAMGEAIIGAANAIKASREAELAQQMKGIPQ